MRQPVKKISVISLAALAIALFMTLPRVAIVTYLQANPHPRMIDITSWDLVSKCFYSFLIAWVFLGLNVSAAPLTSIFRSVNMARLSHRLAMNLILLILVKCFSVYWASLKRVS